MDAAIKKYGPTRLGRRPCTAFVELDMFKRLEWARVEQDKTMQRVVHEALELWLAEHEKKSTFGQACKG